MKDRFNLEEEILAIYTFSEQLKLISEGVLEYNLSPDETSNALQGLSTLMDLHCTKMMDTMCQCFNLDQENTNDLFDKRNHVV